MPGLEPGPRDEWDWRTGVEALGRDFREASFSPPPPALPPALQNTGELDAVVTADWTPQTIDSWRHSIWVGVWDPWIVVFKGPRIWYKTVREIVTLERMHRAFADGLMEYGMMKARKKSA